MMVTRKSEVNMGLEIIIQGLVFERYKVLSIIGFFSCYKGDASMR